MGQAACLLGSGGSDTLKSRHDTRRATEVAIAIKFLNRKRHSATTLTILP